MIKYVQLPSVAPPHSLTWWWHIFWIHPPGKEEKYRCINAKAKCML